MQKYSAISLNSKNQNKMLSGFHPAKSFSYKPSMQPKLTVSQPNKSYEQQPNSVDNRVIGIPQKNFLQTKHLTPNSLHRKPLSQTITPLIQPKSDSVSKVSGTVTHSIKTSAGRGNSMDSGTQSFMNTRFNNDFSNVKIHTDSEAIHLSRNLKAKAFTVGSDIYFKRKSVKARFKRVMRSGKCGYARSNQQSTLTSAITRHHS